MLVEIEDDRLSLRKMSFDGIEYDDWLVIWRGVAVGQMIRQQASNGFVRETFTLPRAAA